MEREQNDQILERLRTDIVSADFQFSLLVAALSSYRHDTVLRPFPPSFINRESNGKDYQSLVSVVDAWMSIYSNSPTVCSE